MLSEFARLLQDQSEKEYIDLIERDIRDMEIENASLVVMNLTLQFIPLADRLPLLQRIYQGMRPGGALLLSEKLVISNEQINQVMIDAHLEFKQHQGYSELEIAQKRSSLENVLIPETIEQHYSRFREAGFQAYNLWFQCLNFCSMIAVK